MLRILIVLLIIGWLLGFFAFNVGALIHILLVVAVIVLVVDLLRGRAVA
jgi:hypothetical protein